jgi:hypothetical protein
MNSSRCCKNAGALFIPCGQSVITRYTQRHVAITPNCAGAMGNRGLGRS